MFDEKINSSDIENQLGTVTNRGVTNHKANITVEGNTYKGVLVTFHWLQLTFYSEPSNPINHFLRHFLELSLEHEFEWQYEFYSIGRGRRGYKTIMKGPEGAYLYCYPAENDRIDCHLELKGAFLEQYTPAHIIEYLRSLDEWGIPHSVKEIHTAYDHMPFTPLQCYSAWNANNKISKNRKKKFIDGDSYSFYIGSKHSDRRICVYDMRGFTRLEIRYENSWSQAFVNEVKKSNPEEWIPKSIGNIRDFIDFVDRNQKRDNAGQYPLLPWWQEFVGDIDKIRLSLDVEVNDRIKDRLDNLVNQVDQRLYLAKYGAGMDINGRIDKAGMNLNKKNARDLKILLGEKSH